MKHIFTLWLVFFVLIRMEGAAQPFLGPDVMVCPDNYVVLDAGPGYVSYLWNTGSTAQSITVTVAGPYWVEVTTGTGSTMRDTVNVVYYPPMLPLTVTVIDPTCNFDNGVIIINEPEELEYIYSIDGGLTFQEEELFTGLPAGVYEVIAEDMNGCAELIVTVTFWNIGPVIDTIETTPATNGQSNGTLLIHATGAGLEYWIQGFSALQSSPYFTGLPAGVYTCGAADNYECIVTQEAIVETVTGTDSGLPDNRYFTISPNPANGICRITFAPGTPVPPSVSITNMQGNEVKHIPSIQGNELQLNLSAGLYFVSVLVNGKRYVEKLVVF